MCPDVGVGQAERRDSFTQCRIEKHPLKPRKAARIAGNA
jgi:hypothetical protein